MALEELAAALRKKGYKVSVFATAQEATDYLCTQMQNTTVGIGGSVTVEQMGLYDALLKNNTVYWHWRLPEGATKRQIRTAALRTESYISSVNGITETGEIVNIDGASNRVAAMNYGHERVFFVVGKNKVAKDLEAAVWRARNIAAPLNAKLKELPLPCAVKGDRCYDCSSPERICRSLNILWQAPTGSQYEVVLIDQNLGF